MNDDRIDLQWEIEREASFPAEDSIRHWITKALSELQTSMVELCVRFVSETEMQTLNHQYRDKQGSTNVLSFEIGTEDEDGHLLLGDIVICADVVNREAMEQNKSMDSHLAHMLIHGILHLQGHDHVEEAQAKTMESLEINLLAALGFNNPYE